MPKSRLKKDFGTVAGPLAAGLFLIWALGLFAFYFNFGQMPDAWAALKRLGSLEDFGAGWPQHLGVLAQTLGAFALSLLTLVNSWWLGGLFFEILGLRAKGAGGAFLELAGGALGSSLFWMGWGLTGLWAQPLMIFLWILALAPAFWKLKQRLDLARLPALPDSRGLRLLAWVAVGYELFGFWQALLPETFYDSLNYFLGIPAYWVLKGGVADAPGQALSGYFHGGTLFFMDGFYFGGAAAAKLLAFFSTLGCALFAGIWAGEEGGKDAGWTAFSLTAIFPLLFLNGWAARVDGLLTLCLLLFFWAARNFWLKTRPRESGPWGLAAALLLGFALTVKPTAFLAPLAAGAALGILHFNRVKAKGIGSWAAMAMLALGLVAPWLIKNFAYTANPFFPYAAQWGGRPFFEPGAARLLYENRQFLSWGHGPMDWLSFPWRLLMPSGAAGQSQFAGPLLLAFLPLSFWAWRRGGAARFLILASFFFLVFGLCLSHMLRFVMPAFVLAFMAWGLGMESAPSFWRQAARALSLAAALLALPYFLDTASRYFDGLTYLTGGESRDHYLGRMVQNPYEDLVEWTDENLPTRARLLLVGDARGLYWRRDFLANSAFDEPFLAVIARTSATPAQMAERVRRLGVDDAVANIPEGMRTAQDYRSYGALTDADWRRLGDYVALYWRPIYSKGFQAVYAIGDEPAAQAQGFLNPFSFFTPQAYDYGRAMAQGDGSAARAAALAQESLFPQDAFWKTRAQWARGKKTSMAERKP